MTKVLKETPGDRDFTPDNVLAFIRKKPPTTDEVKRHFRQNKKPVEDMIRGIQDAGSLVFKIGDRWRLEKKPAQAKSGDSLELLSDDDDTFLIGFSSDQHLGSKYSRLDTLHDLYGKFAEAGVKVVLNAGNWIDGDAPFNRHDLLVHGLGPQCQYMAENYPQLDGITTYAVAGDDHEGWTACREGIDPGKFAENIMRDNGRSDWVNLGYMEAFVKLANSTTGKSARLLLCHPGGGSAYAVSYQPQKLVESLEGGSKPAVLLLGHYHKLGVWNIRNVWAVLSGTTQDQTPFMRKKRIDAHVGGGILRLTQDSRTGAITRCAADIIRYFDSGYYENHRWNKSGPVTLPRRAA